MSFELLSSQLSAEIDLLFNPKKITVTQLQKTCLTITGPEARLFLEKQLTQNISKLTPNNPIPLAAACTRQGRVLCVFSIFQTNNPDCFYLTLPTSLLETSLRYLKYYSQFNKLSINIEKWAVFGISRPKNNSNHSNYSDHSNFSFIKHAIQFPTFIPPKNKILTEYITESNLLHSELLTVNQTPIHMISPRAWRSYLILNHYLELSVDTINKYLPQSLNLITHQAIDFQKGCYLGQEIISRVHYRGQVKQVLSLQESPTPIDLNDQILDWSLDPKTKNYIFLTL